MIVLQLAPAWDLETWALLLALLWPLESSSFSRCDITGLPNLVDRQKISTGVPQHPLLDTWIIQLAIQRAMEITNFYWKEKEFIHLFHSQFL